MPTIEELEKLIENMRTQANALNAGADALEASLVPMKAVASSFAEWNRFTSAMWSGWNGKSVLDEYIKAGWIDDPKLEKEKNGK
jgi:phosphosulfolactate phosphohydrolase-like enzyme